MSVDYEGHEPPRSPLEAQIDLILHGIPDVVEPLEEAAAWPPEWREEGRVDYLYRQRTLLVRDADVNLVIEGQRGEQPLVLATPEQHDNNLRGLTRLRFSPEEAKTVQEACDLVDRALGEPQVAKIGLMWRRTRISYEWKVVGSSPPVRWPVRAS